MDSEGNPRNFDLEDKNPKRRMKTPFQLEALERLYAEDRYPTEAVRAELSLHLNLSDKQLQMWFCHRRLKDRKYRVDELPSCLKKQKTQPCGSNLEVWHSSNLDSAIGENVSLTHGDGYQEEAEMKHHQWSLRSYHGSQEADNLKTRRSDALVSLWNSAVVSGNPAFGVVKAHLGDQVCDDGPVMGVEFDTLPSGAFGSAIGEQVYERAQTAALHLLRTESAAEDEHPGTCSQKMGEVGISMSSAVGLQCKKHVEQNVADEQYLNVVKEDGNRGNAALKSNAHPDRSNETVNSAKELYAPRSKVDESITKSFFPSVECKDGLHGTSGLGLNDDYERRVRGFGVQGQVGICHSGFHMKLAGQLSAMCPRLASTEDLDRLGTPFKVIEESETLVQRARRELERQEAVKRKKEVQKRREIEKQDRDKRKEEERVARERQREEERIQREQRREIERQERRALKENKRMEKQQQREELRRAKEAAKLKAASERAAAKKVTRELMDKIEDDELELLERAVSLESSRSHKMDDHDILGPIDTSKELLTTFPPSAVKMSTPLTFCMWDGLEHALGHLFMVWRFLTTFADVIGLWPFTLDEFEGALHDFDSRLLSEIHVSLIKMVVKNIEDAARATANGSVGSQNGISLVAGGHPQILEAAAEWGFNVSDWGQHVNLITWPDILRQFALSAGYGPKWRRRHNIHVNAVNGAQQEQVKGEVENIVTSLRSGVAAANAVAQMLGKGVRHPRKCRYRLTPGTVKYAAFHVLSLEGEKGLTISEVAGKIQKSGLRDLKTSKTPEASIAAALSRDANLFERVAPSTYCVRSTFRKDANDRVEVLQSAKDRIQLFQSGFIDVDDADNIGDEADDMEKDSDYDSDGQDVENGAASPPGKKDVDGNDEAQREDACLGKLMNDTTEMIAVHEGEAWVQGLMEGEYSELSIEERLMALVALINVVTEGNTVRIALEARIEAAGTLKRQLWAEAQFEKRRQKEEQMSRLQSAAIPDRRSESCSPTNIMAKKSPTVSATEDKPNEIQVSTQRLENEIPGGADNFVGNALPAAQESQTGFQCCTNSYLQRERSRADVRAGLGTWAEELYVIRSAPLGLDRRRNRYWQFICGDGQDSSYGRIYFESSLDGRWEVIDSEETLDAFMSSLDIRGTREAGLHAALLQVEAVLRQGIERAAMTQSRLDLTIPARYCSNVQDFEVSELWRRNTKVGQALAEKTCEFTFEVETDEKTLPKKQRLFENLKDFEHWIWIDSLQTFFASRSSKSRKLESNLLPICAKCRDVYEAIDRHCQVCHPTPSKCSAKLSMASNKKDSRWDIPPRLHVLKAQIMAIEVSIPPEALKSNWEPHYRKSWASLVKSAVTATELFQALLTLEREIEPGWLSSYIPEMSSSIYSMLSPTGDFDDAPWIPRTSAAVGLRAMAFDAAFSKCPELKRRHVREERGRNNANSSSR